MLPNQFKKVIVDLVEGLMCIGKMNTSILVRSYGRLRVGPGLLMRIRVGRERIKVKMTLFSHHQKAL